MLSFKVAAIATAFLSLAATTTALADQWVDYAPANEPWDVTTVKVAPGKLDDYIVSLRKSWAMQLEEQKKAGDVVDYHILVNTNENAAGATIVFLIKFKDWSMLAPNKARDLKEQEDFRKAFTKDAEQKLGDDRSKYRTFLDEGTYADITFLK